MLRLKQNQTLPVILVKVITISSIVTFGLICTIFFHQEAINLEVAKKSKIPASVWNRLPARDKEQLKKVVAYYRNNLLDKDLRFSDYMTEFKKWILVQDPNTLSSIPEKFKEHASHLQKVEKLYRKAFWESHDSSNKKILNNNSKLIKRHRKSGC